MKVKRYLASALLGLSVGMFALALSACGKTKGVQFENWENKGEATASLGEIYKIQDLSIIDTKGNVYFYDIDVLDSKGKKVAVVGGEFDVMDLNGYTIEYTLQVNEGDIRTREVTLNVVDDTAPRVAISLPTGFVNTKYTIPDITVTDLSGESIEPSYVVYAKSDVNKTPIKLTNGAFTPTVKGTYAIEITAKDSSGNEAKVVKEFGIRADAPENILENFDDPSSMLNSINGAENQEWLESFEGREGVIHIKGTSAEKTVYLFRFMRDKETYKHLPFDSITVSLYVPKRADLYQTTSDGSKLTDWFDAQAGRWSEFTITNFEEWNYLFNGGISDRGAPLFWTWTKDTDIYIDEIRFAATPKVDFECSAIDNKVVAGEEVSISATVKADDRLEPYLTVKSPSGQKVSLKNGKFTATETGWYVVKAIVETAEWSYYDTTAEYKILCLGNYIKVGDDFKDEDIGTEYVLSDSHLINTSFILPAAKVINPIAGEEIAQSITITVTRNGKYVFVQNQTFTPNEAGVYEVIYTSGEYTTVCKVYVVCGLQENELENFGHKDSVEQVKYGLDGQGVGKTPEWLPEFEGRTGVVKMNDNASEAGYMVRINMTYEALKALEWDYIDVDVYLKSGDWLMWGYAVDRDMGAINPSKAWTNGAWTSITISRSDLKDEDAFLKALTGNVGAQLFWGWDIKDDVYIDGLRIRSVENVLNDFASSASTAECLNGSNGKGSAATWLESYEGANGVIKVNDGGNMGGFYIRTTRVSASALAAYEWDYIEIKIWATNSSWVMFYEQDLATKITGGQWTTLKISREVIEQEMSLSSFCALLAGDSGAQIFWSWDDLGDVYFDEIIFN